LVIGKVRQNVERYCLCFAQFDTDLHLA
jgi:hypothetical protein